MFPLLVIGLAPVYTHAKVLSCELLFSTICAFQLRACAFDAPVLSFYKTLGENYHVKSDDFMPRFSL